MSGQRYTPEFKDEAVKLIAERGYSVPDVAERLSVSLHSIYKWLKGLYATVLMNMNFGLPPLFDQTIGISLIRMKVFSVEL